MSRLCLPVCLILLGLAAPTLGRGDPAPKQAPEQTLRYLRIRNATDEVLKVYLRYSTDATGQLQPALEYTVPPATDLFLERDRDKEGKALVTARRIRLWAESPTARWTRYKDQDILMKPYRAHCLRTFTYTFSK